MTPFPLRTRLRDETADAHRRLDEGLAGHDLATVDGYGRFLDIHARALLPLEEALAEVAPWPAWQPRGALLRADLAGLGRDLPDPLPVAAPADADAAWGMLYVLEGSRLGGAMLAGRVGPGLPHAYLACRHAAGEWRAFLAAMDAGVSDAAAAVRGAHAAFGLFAQAAAREPAIA